jgi:hypothetical protein
MQEHIKYGVWLFRILFGGKKFKLKRVDVFVWLAPELRKTAIIAIRPKLVSLNHPDSAVLLYSLHLPTTYYFLPIVKVHPYDKLI